MSFPRNFTVSVFKKSINGVRLVQRAQNFSSVTDISKNATEAAEDGTYKVSLVVPPSLPIKSFSIFYELIVSG